MFVLNNGTKATHERSDYMGKKKIDKEYLLTDDSINCYGFRLLTSGLMLDEVKKNPIGFLMHKRDDGVVHSWTDFRLDGDKLFAKPVINTKHPRAEQTISEIENGFLNGASVGMIQVHEISEDPKDYLPNQSGPTVTKWFYRECSLVDISGNFNAVSYEQIGLFDANDNPINLADFTNPNTPIMDKPVFTAQQLLSMNLSAEAKQPEANKAFENLVAKAGRADQAEKELADLKAATTTKEVKDLLAQALTDSKITKDLSAKLEVKYADDPAGLTDLLGTMPKYKSVQDQLTDDPKTKKLDNLMAKSWDELHKADELENLKALDPKGYEIKYKEKFDK